MSKPKFNPEQPYDVVQKPKFDPDMPFDVSNVEQSPLGEPLQNATDLGYGFAQGATLGGADELTAAAKALYNAPGNSKSLSELYSQYKDIEDKKLKDVNDRSPALSSIGDIIGSTLPAFVTGGVGVAARAGLGLGKGVALNEARKVGAKALGKELLTRAATTGATTGVTSGAEGALRSEDGKLINATPEEQDQLLGEAKSSASFGGLLDTLMSGAGKASKGFAGKAFKAAEDASDTVKLGSKAYELAKEGVPLVSRKARDEAKVGLRSKAMAEDLTDRILAADSQLGKEVGQSIADATKNGVTTTLNSIPEELREMIPGYKNITMDALEKAEPEQVMEVFKQVENNKRLLQAASPQELKTTVQNLQTEIGYLKDIPQEARKRDMLIKLHSTLNDQLKSSDEGIGKSYEKFSKYRDLIPEKLINQGLDSDRTGKYLGNVSHEKGKLDQSVIDLLHNETKSGKPSAERTKQGLLQGIEQLEQEHPDILQSMGISSSNDFKKELREKGAEVGAIELGAGTPYNGQSAPLQMLKQSIPLTKEGAVVYGAAAGNIARSRPVKFGKEMYNLDNTAYSNIGDKLMQSNSKTLQAIGDSLKSSIEIKDSAKRNAAIFSILQNPEARKLFGEKNEEEK